MIAPRVVVVMGPSGCGKTTLARKLAQSLGWRFVEADDLHPLANVEKMRAGVPLDDADRAPWLEAVGRELSIASAAGVVATCSALKRRYRDRLRALAGPVVFILPQVPRQILAARLAARTGHYMPPTLLDSQLADLEPLADETGFVIDGTAGVDAQVAFIRSALIRATTPA
ncbi:MAG: gluconokinase [Steroidobacteraceae bacterium]